MKDVLVYKRGQVWFINDEIVNKGSIQSNSRPYVVVSNDECNANSTVIHMAPITTKVKKEMSTHVIFHDNDSLYHTILLEQIMPKSLPHIKRCAKYMYTLSDDIMEKVDKAILAQFDLLQYHTESPEHRYVESEEYQNTLSEIATTEEVYEGVKESQIDKFNKRMNKYKDINGIIEPVDIDRSKSGRIRWNDELKKQLVSDSEIMSVKDILDKYNMKLSTYRTNLSNIKRELSKKEGN